MPRTKQELENLLGEVEAFMKSELYSHFRFTVETDLTTIKESICHTCPASVEEVLAKQKEYGEKEFLQKQLTIFEEFRAGLKQKLAELV